MGKKDPRVDAYIKKAAPFAQPILKHLRAVVHEACPDVEETLKWGMPAFMHQGIMCGIAAFKHHCTFGFWKGKLVLGGSMRPSDDAMGQFGQITTLAGLPSKQVIAGYVKKAAALNEAGIAVKRLTRPKPPLRTPADLRAALAKNRRALATFEAFSPSARREYVEWVTEAKQPVTRARRIATTVEWVAEGKKRNWKYEHC